MIINEIFDKIITGTVKSAIYKRRDRKRLYNHLSNKYPWINLPAYSNHFGRDLSDETCYKLFTEVPLFNKEVVFPNCLSGFMEEWPEKQFSWASHPDNMDSQRRCMVKALANRYQHIPEGNPYSRMYTCYFGNFGWRLQDWSISMWDKYFAPSSDFKSSSRPTIF